MFLKSGSADILVQASGAGPNTLVAHGGWVGSGELWLPPFELLSRNWRTVTYDHRGSGGTISRAPAITFELLVRDLFDVLDRLGIERCVLAGESSGAAIVLEAALRQPQRFQGLVLVGARYVGTLSPGIERMLQGCKADFPATMSAFVDACVPEADCAAERAWGKQIVMRSNAKDAVEFMEALTVVDVEARLGALTMPALVLHGRRDAISPVASSEKLATLLPDAVLAILDEAGHVPTVTRPEWIAEQIDARFGRGGAKLAA
jgi:pimeloyl-ACP methyl ester carboxylesterase